MNLQDMKENRSASVLYNENLQRYDPLVFSRQQKGMVGWVGMGRESWGCGVGTVRLTRRCTCPGLCAALLNYPTLADRVFSRLLTLIFLCELYFGFLSHVEGKSVFPSASHHHPPPPVLSFL